MALILGVAGWFMPAYLDAVAPFVLQEAGLPGPRPMAAAEQFLDEGKAGPAWRMEQAVRPLRDPNGVELVPGEDDRLNQRLAQFIADHPEDRLIGSAEAYGQQFLNLAPRRPSLPEGIAPTPFMHLLSHEDNRHALKSLLSGSRNQNVQDVLATLNLTGVRKFMPVQSAAGAPLESSILTTALLIQSGYMSPEFARGVAQMGQHANGGDAAAISRLEAFYLSVLGAAQRLDWASLGMWTQMAQDPLSFMRVTTLLRQSGDRESLVFAIACLSQRPDWLADYYENFGNDGWPDLERAFLWGTGPLNYLLELQLPLYRGPAIGRASVKETPLSQGSAGQVLAYFCAERRLVALGLKFFLLLIAGVFLASGMKKIFASLSDPASTTGTMAWLQNCSLGVLVLLVIVSWQEPQLFAQPVTEPGVLFLEFELPAAQATVESETMPNASLDQQTVLVLLIFFMVQLVIYVVCLVKVSSVKRAPVSAETRINLLENEEPLFDLGLYVGLAGTVISLLMLAMGVVQASLVSAYASTLFGIIFVAMLKILHVRPLKHKLILENR
ncbi:MAG: hypothetical protein AAFX93_07790 [Verrucomicrobiota bacterium]